MALALPCPALAGTDDVNVTISVPELVTFEAGADVNLTATMSDINQKFIFEEDASTMMLRCNTSGWTLTASLDSAFTDYALYVEDNKNLGHVSGSGFNLIPAAPSSNDMNWFDSYGAAGSHTYNLDWLVINLGWSSQQGDQVRTVTFTLTS